MIVQSPKSQESIYFRNFYGHEAMPIDYSGITMSAAQSDLVVELAHEREKGGPGQETPRHKAAPGSALEELLAEFQHTHEPVIAVDMDDVLTQTNEVVALWHNEAYGTEMGLEHFYYYHYWQNPFWGTPEETFRKVEEFWTTPWIENAPPVEGAYEGAKKLRELGYRLVVVTARQKREMDRGMRWLEKHFPGIFDTMICTGQSQETLAEPHEALTKLSKAGVCHKLGAKFLIDDSLENALKCVNHDPPTHVLLFGDREWNKRESKYDNIKTELSFDERLEKEGGKEFWKDEEVKLADDIPLTRVKDWEGVVAWVKEARKSGRL